MQRNSIILRPGKFSVPNDGSHRENLESQKDKRRKAGSEAVKINRRKKPVSSSGGETSESSKSSSFMESIKKTLDIDLAKDFNEVDQRIARLTTDVCNIKQKLDKFHVDISNKVETYGKECLQNFKYINVHTEYSKLLDEKGIKKSYNYAEISDTALEKRTDSDGQILYDISLTETNFTNESTYSSNIDSGDFILKITHSTGPPTFIRIPAKQMVFEKAQNSSVKRETAGLDKHPNLRNFQKNMRSG